MLAAATYECVIRLTKRPFLKQTPPTTKSAKKNFITERCRVCYQKRIRKEATCISSGRFSHPALCSASCFELYHTKLNYWEKL